jgi:hypothetical protein
MDHLHTTNKPHNFEVFTWACMDTIKVVLVMTASKNFFLHPEWAMQQYLTFGAFLGRGKGHIDKVNKCLSKKLEVKGWVTFKIIVKLPPKHIYKVQVSPIFHPNSS